MPAPTLGLATVGLCANYAHFTVAGFTAERFVHRAAGLTPFPPESKIVLGSRASLNLTTTTNFEAQADTAQQKERESLPHACHKSPLLLQLIARPVHIGALDLCEPYSTSFLANQHAVTVVFALTQDPPSVALGCVQCVYRVHIFSGGQALKPWFGAESQGNGGVRMLCQRESNITFAVLQ